ncbi:MAG TPA: hypothetical protein VK927_08790, partial [Adhaeribacter sp.]|nr:hypothetical protein [Adhaeribacter sp.]
DDKIWTERNFFKDTDYRYRSGHRDQWHRDYDREYDPNYRGDRRQPHDESFLNRIGDGIREGWNNLIHSDREREENQYYDRDRGYTRPQDRMQDRRDNRRFGPEEERERGYTRRESEWKNSGPDHRDEDYIHPTDPRY